MKIHPIIATLICAGVMSLQYWTLSEVVKLKTEVAIIAYKLDQFHLATK